MRWQKDGSGAYVLTNLNTLIAPGQSLKLYSAEGINDAGQIVCMGYYLDPVTGQVIGDGEERAFVLTPQQSKIDAAPVNRPSDGIYRIPTEPKMPTITLSARITGLTPDPTANTDFEWHYRIVYQSPTVRATGEPLDLSFPVPDAPTIDAVVHSTSDAPVTLDFKDKIRGGDLVVTVKATVGGKPLQASVTGLTIRAADVPWAAVYGALPHDALRRIARVGAGGKRAFMADGTPIWNQQDDGSTDGGVGPMRIRDLTLTNDRIADLVWNWRANVAAGIARFNAGMAASERHYTLVTGQGPGPGVSPRERLAAQSRWNGYLAWINAQRRRLNRSPLAGLYLAPFTSTGNYNYVRNVPPSQELNQKELNTIRLYDGTGGYVDDLGLPLLEFEVVTESIGGRVVPKVLRVVPYGTGLVGVVGYRRVAPKERPGASGKPNAFVDRVLDPYLDYRP